MKKGLMVFFVFAIFIALISGVYAIAGDEIIAGWDKVFSIGGNFETAFSVDTDNSGNVYVTGAIYNQGGSGNQDWVIKKYDSTGNEDTTNWNKTFDGGRHDAGIVARVDNFGNVYFGGRRGLAQSGSYETWIKKFYYNGTEDLSWNKTLRLGYESGPEDILIDSFGDIYVVGHGGNLFNLTSNYDWFIKKFYSNGSEIAGWNKIIDYNGRSNFPAKAALDINDNLYVGGRILLNDGWRSLVKKYNSAGNEDAGWNKISGGNSIAFDISGDSSNNVYVASFLRGSSTGQDWHIEKYDSAGNEDATFNKTLDLGGFDDVPYSIEVYDTNVYVAGTNGVIGWIKKFDLSGNEDVISWNKTIGSMNRIYSLAVDNSSGNIYVAGSQGNFAGWRIKKYEGDSGGGFAVTMSSFIGPEEFSEGVIKPMSLGEVVEFGIEEENHSVTMNSIENDSIIFTVQSEPIVVTLNVGENVSLDVDFDSISDVYLRLDSIENGKADLFIKQIIPMGDEIEINESDINLTEGGEENSTFEDTNLTYENNSIENSTSLENNSSVGNETSGEDNDSSTELSKKEKRQKIKDEIKEIKSEIKDNRNDIKELREGKKDLEGKRDKNVKKEIKSAINSIREKIRLLKDKVLELKILKRNL